jgi:hypothetical protein
MYPETIRCPNFTVSTRKSDRADEISREILERLSFDFRKSVFLLLTAKWTPPLQKNRKPSKIPLALLGKHLDK